MKKILKMHARKQTKKRIQYKRHNSKLLQLEGRLLNVFQNKCQRATAYLSQVMRKPAFYTYSAFFVFIYIASTLYIPSTSLIPKFKPLAIFYCCKAWFVSDLDRNLEYRFSHNVPIQ